MLYLLSKKVHNLLHSQIIGFLDCWLSLQDERILYSNRAYGEQRTIDTTSLTIFIQGIVSVTATIK